MQICKFQNVKMQISTITKNVNWNELRSLKLGGNDNNLGFYQIYLLFADFFWKSGYFPKRIATKTNFLDVTFESCSNDWFHK